MGPQQILRAVGARAITLRASPAFSPLALTEAWTERRGHPIDRTHLPHLVSATDWLVRAQNVWSDGGFARGFSLRWHPEFGAGWQPSYPETTGYIIPTLFEIAHRLDREDLAARAERAARWLIEVQLPSGAIQGGVIGASTVAPAVFNTGQVMFGWLAAYEKTGDPAFADALRRAGRFLLDGQEPDGLWRRGNSRFANPRSTLYNTRVAWALAETGIMLDEPDFRAAAHRNLRASAARQYPNGWFPDCCLNDASRPLLHTLAYAIRGVLEGGARLGDDVLLVSAARAAAQVAALVRRDGWLPGRIDARWKPAVSWACLTGSAQMVNIWLRLARITGEGAWRRPVTSVLDFLKRTQNRTSQRGGVRGGIRGAAPIGAPYGAYEVLNWPTKFFLDALLRDSPVPSNGRKAPDEGALRFA